MNKAIIDSSAWVEYFNGSAAGKQIARYIEHPRTAVLTSGVIVAEVCVNFLKSGKRVDDAVLAFSQLTELVPFDIQLGRQAATAYVWRRKTKPKFSLADATILAIARLQRVKIITCDRDFEGLPEALVIQKQ